MTLTSRVKLELSADLSSALDLTTASAPLKKIFQTLLAHGTTAGKADRIWHDERTLAASATEDLDLAGAALLDPFGAAVVFARIKALVVYAAPGNTNNVVIGAASSNPWATLLGTTHTLTLRPGTTLAVFAGPADATGYAVTAGTGDLLKVANSAAGTGVTYQMAVLGCSA
jgi:hypothetical protein